MARVGPKKLFQTNFRIPLDDDARFRELSRRCQLDRAEIARDAILLYLSISERAPSDLKPKALAAWLEAAAGRALLSITLNHAAPPEILGDPARDKPSRNGARRPRS